MFLAWSFLGGLIIAAFFIAAFFGEFGPLQFEDTGAVILFMPVFTAFVLGLLLVDYELLQTVVGAVLTTVIAVALILLFMFAPLLAGVAGQGGLFQQFALQRAALSAVLLFPLVLLGTVVGRAIGERILPPDETRKRRDALAAETRAWHEQLGGRGAGSSLAEKEKGKP